MKPPASLKSYTSAKKIFDNFGKFGISPALLLIGGGDRLRFDLIYLYPQQKIVPTVEIDRVWHHHILDTSKYAADCEMLFGRFIHHFPYLGQSGDRQQWQQAFSQSQTLFHKHFGIDILSQNKEDTAAPCEPLVEGQSPACDRPTIDIELTISWDGDIVG